MRTKLLFISLVALLTASCSPAARLGRSARKNVMGDSALRTAHVGITVYDPEARKYLYNHDGDKYFVPASNTKIPTCYAAMKFLGDSLVGLRYELAGNDIFVEPTADPTFLHPEFKKQPAFDFLRSVGGRISLNLSGWQEEGWGSGWSWNDYGASYMAERSPMPLYGNVVVISNTLNSLKIEPRYFINRLHRDSSADWNLYPSSIDRSIGGNEFRITGTGKTSRTLEVPFYTEGGAVAAQLLGDTLHRPVVVRRSMAERKTSTGVALHSQPTDSLLKPMMHRSDNFFAEQSLLMASNEVLGVMKDAEIIDTLLKSDFRDLPQKPRWADGSGLSRYNLFTPQDLVAILDKMRTAFGMDRIKEIFPTGNEGTLTNYYRNESGHIFAKTGTLSGVVALSGFLYTTKGRLLIFSVLVNNHQASATAVRRAVERFVQELRRF